MCYASAADLVLMGITPTYPSSKYECIVPRTIQESAEMKYTQVARFTEKPSVEVTEELVEKDIER